MQKKPFFRGKNVTKAKENCHHLFKIAGKHQNKISAFCIIKRGQPLRWDVIKNHQQGRPHNSSQFKIRKHRLSHNVPSIKEVFAKQKFG